LKNKVLGRAAICFSTLSICLSLNSFCFADALSDARNEYNRITKQIEANQSAISAVEKEVQGYIDEIQVLDSEIATYT